MPQSNELGDFPALSFGTSRLHHSFSTGTRSQLLHAAIECGFTHLDTSPYYGSGLSQEAIGALPSNLRSKVTIASKVCIYPSHYYSSLDCRIPNKLASLTYPLLSKPEIDFSLQRAKLSLENTLRQLRVDYLDILYLHEPKVSLILQPEWSDWISNLKSSGRIRSWGIAGERDLISSFLLHSCMIPDYVQTRCLPRSSNTQLTASKMARTPDFLYGAFSSPRPKTIENARYRLSSLLRENPMSTVIFSSTSIDHILAFSSLNY